jgi:hypothetical protein
MAVTTTPPDDFSDTIRRMVDTENTLLNHRMGWLTTLQGLLFASLGVAWDKPRASLLIPILCGLGIGTAVTILLSLIGASRAQAQLIAWWDIHRPESYAGPDIVGLRPASSKLGVLLDPWNWLAAMFVAAWLAVIVGRLSAAQHSSPTARSSIPTVGRTLP